MYSTTITNLVQVLWSVLSCVARCYQLISYGMEDVIIVSFDNKFLKFVLTRSFDENVEKLGQTWLVPPPPKQTTCEFPARLFGAMDPDKLSQIRMLACVLIESRFVREILGLPKRRERTKAGLILGRETLSYPKTDCTISGSALMKRESPNYTITDSRCDYGLSRWLILMDIYISLGNGHFSRKPCRQVHQIFWSPVRIKCACPDYLKMRNVTVWNTSLWGWLLEYCNPNLKRAIPCLWLQIQFCSAPFFLQQCLTIQM